MITYYNTTLGRSCYACLQVSTGAMTPKVIKDVQSLTGFKCNVKNGYPYGVSADCVKYTLNT